MIEKIKNFLFNKRMPHLNNFQRTILYLFRNGLIRKV